MGFSGTTFVPVICCPDRASWGDPLGRVLPLGRRSRTQARAASGVLEKCFSKLLARTGLFSERGLFWLA